MIRASAASANAFEKVFEHALAPITGTQWNMENYILPEEVGSHRSRFVPFPYQRGLLDVMCADNAEFERVTIKKSSRIGFTAVNVGAIMFQLGKSRRNVVFYAQNDTDAKLFTKDTIDPTFAENPVVSAALDEIRDKRSHNTATYKNLNGKSLRVVGANASGSYRRFTADTAFLDEVDTFPRSIRMQKGEEEGSPISLASVRVSTSTRGGLVILGGSPIEKNTSLVYGEYLKADAVFKYYVKCPHCNRRHSLEWEFMKDTIPYADGSGLDHEERVSKVGHVCPLPNCGAMTFYSDLAGMLATGRWQVPKKRESSLEPLVGHYIQLDEKGYEQPKLLNKVGDRVPFPKKICFEIWAGYAPNYSWEKLAASYIEAEDDPGMMKSFINTKLGRPWTPTTEEVSEAELRARERDIKELPVEYEVVYAGIDVQKGKVGKDGWLSMLLTAYAPGEKCIIFDRIEFHGEINSPTGSAWLQLVKWLRNTPTWKNEIGQRVKLHGIAIDARHATDTVHKMYHYLSRIISSRRVFVMQGVKHLEGKGVVKYKPKEDPRRIEAPLYTVGTYQAKETLMHRFHEEGRVILSKSLPKEVIPELMSERIEVETRGGRKTTNWRTVPGQERNEALDCSVYTLAMHRLMNPKFRKKAKQKKPVKVEREAKPDVEQVEEINTSEQANNPEQNKPKPAPKRRRKRRMRTVFQVVH